MPTQFGKYTLEKKIGAGGMADVWLAQGPNGVCVLKCPHPHLCGNADFVRMFLDEASLLAQLHHPGIAQISDLGQVKGVYFLAMEYVAGFDLMTVSLEHERHGELMGPELCARIVADAAAALHYAHEALGKNGLPLHIVHRDVTPHNILLSRQGVVKLIDFGVAKAASTMHRTQAGFVKGKYPYMSPEQITGQVIDRRVDVYALGLVLYELLTNVRAIPGNTEVEQIDAARSGRIRPIEQLRPNVPVPLRQILGGCLHMDVEGRYPTAQALKVDLEKFLTLERQVVGQDDLLRLFRVVAADVGEVPGPEARPTELDQPVSASGVVVLPDRQADAAKVDELGYSSTLPSMKSLEGAQAEPRSASGTGRIEAHTDDHRVPPSKAPMIVLAVLSVTIIGLVLLLWQPWVTPVGPVAVVDAGGTIPGKIEAFVFPPIDAGKEVAEVIDAGAPAVTMEVKGAVVNVMSVIEADVLVDGKKFGRTPQELELMPGPHTIIVRNTAEGVEKKVQWKLKAGETKTLSVPAPSAAPVVVMKGHLHVNAPPFCALSIDGKRQAGAPVAVWEVDLTEGKHSISCTLEDPSLPRPRVKTQSVVITADQDSRLAFDMMSP
ncbi:MAG: serine/threonine-protein kinase [Archangium sp.]|nr:serine/threonine-protein kinase [Archangium sp.]MDP3569777.1 serine/threonine-protein kinase [Archangium sp.]